MTLRARMLAPFCWRMPCSNRRRTARRHIQPALLAADLAAAREIRGVVQCVSAACISGLLAIQQGATLLRRGQADLVFVAGVDLVSHFVLSGFTTLKSLDPEGCRPFDRARVGLSLGEGAGALVLVRCDGEPPDSILFQKLAETDFLRQSWRFSRPDRLCPYARDRHSLQ